LWTSKRNRSPNRFDGPTPLAAVSPIRYDYGWPTSFVAKYEGGMRYTVVIRAGNESGYVAMVPTLPGCVSQGRTRRQALRNVKEAIEVYVESLLEDGLPVPVQ
jgi:predicted RNase H-like HicB family nuclease